MLLNEAIFREYDIRGVVDRDFDADFAYALGRAFASKLRDQAEAEASKNEASIPEVAIGWDCRLSHQKLSQALIRGLTAGGVNVLVGAMGPTPQLYYSVFSRRTAGGIQVTGSHNPADNNGFKMMIGERTLSGADIKDLAKRIKNQSQAGGAEQPAPGSVVEWDARSAYIEELVRRSKDKISSAHKVKVVVDAGNGVGGLVGPEVLRRLGCEVIELYTEPDGRFPNHHPDPTELENLEEIRETVVRTGADVGIAWDGDADRIGVVDEKGEPIFGDMLLIIYGRELCREVDSPIIIGDVKCSELLFSDLKGRGARPVMAKTGHSLIKAKIRELGAHLAGEMSGHMFFVHRYFGFDDALHASARLVEILSGCGKKMSELLSDLPKMVSTPEIRVECPDNLKFSLIERLQQSFPEFETNTLDGVRVSFKRGWGLVRASNTQPVLVLRFEAENEDELAEYRGIVEGRIKKVRGEIEP